MSDPKIIKISVRSPDGPILQSLITKPTVTLKEPPRNIKTPGLERLALAAGHCTSDGISGQKNMEDTIRALPTVSLADGQPPMCGPERKRKGV